MEGLRFCNPPFQRVGWVLHGQDHGGDLSVEPHGELGDGGEFVFELRLCGEIFEVVDIFLEPVVGGPVFILSWSLDEVG